MAQIGTPAPKLCAKCMTRKDPGEFHRNAANYDGLSRYCKTCKAAMKATATPRTKRPVRTAVEAAEARMAAEMADAVEGNGDGVRPAFVPRKRYVPSRELTQVFAAAQARVARGQHAPQLMFLGPSGCGKTEAAQYLAEKAGLPFVKVDVAAMTDPESWFGTREVEAQDGVSVTTYRPSVFVQALSQPCLMLLDEVNRVRDEHRNIVLPLMDATHQVTNPLTGETIIKHPGCIIIMSGNRGLQFTGTYPVDPALMTRSSILEFDYLGAADEIAVATERTGVVTEAAALFVRFAQETRKRAKTDPDITPISTREVLEASQYVADGLRVDVAADITIINSASDEGGTASVRARLKQIWVGIRPTYSGS